MTRLCERPGCSAPAEVAYGFDAEHLTVWLDALAAPSAARAGALCRRHADAMVVPRDWTLDDRRELAPPLFRPTRRQRLDEGAEAHPAPMPGRRRRRRRAAADDDTGQLAFDALGEVAPDEPHDPVDATLDGDGAPAAAQSSTVDPPLADPQPEPEPEPELAREPAFLGTEVEPEPELAREPAFLGTELEPDVEPEPVGTELVGTGESVDPTSPLDRPATPWRPVFDQRDDLHGLLRARGSLLSRAFRGAPRPDDPAD